MRPTDTALSRPLQADEARLIAAVWQMNAWEQACFERFVARMAAHDADAENLAELFRAGKITRRQVV